LAAVTYFHVRVILSPNFNLDSLFAFGEVENKKRRRNEVKTDLSLLRMGGQNIYLV